MENSLSPSSAIDAAEDGELAQYQAAFVRRRRYSRIANVDHFSDAMRRYVVSCIDWINTLFLMSNIESTEDKVISVVFEFLEHDFEISIIDNKLFSNIWIFR